MEIIKGNFYLNSEEMNNNAEILWTAMQSMRWSDWAIAAILGNMQTESTLNPGIWQNLDEGWLKGGYGLVQWSPATKLFSWVDENGYAHDDYNGQLARIEWERANGEQYYSTSAYPLSFDEFLHYEPKDGKTDEEACKYLAAAWVKNYERPKNQNQPQRGVQAWRWFQIFHNNVPDPEPEPPPEPPDPPEPDVPDKPENAYKYLWECCGVFWILVRETGSPFVLSSTVRRISADSVEYQGTRFRSIGGNFYKVMRR